MIVETAVEQTIERPNEHVSQKLQKGDHNATDQKRIRNEELWQKPSLEFVDIENHDE